MHSFAFKNRLTTVQKVFNRKHLVQAALHEKEVAVLRFMGWSHWCYIRGQMCIVFMKNKLRSSEVFCENTMIMAPFMQKKKWLKDF